MKRPLFPIAVLSVVALLPFAAQGQRSMGFHGSAPQARVSSGFAGRPAAAPRFAPTARPMTRPLPAARFASPRTGVFISGGRSFFPNRFPNRFGSRRFHFRNRNPFFFGSSCFNGFGNPFFCGSPFLGGGFYDPFFYDYSYASAPQQQQQPVVVEQDNNSRELALQVQELSDEIQVMRDEERNRDEARNNPPSRPATQEQDTILVFKDGHQMTIRNYAIAGGTLWILSQNSARKIPLSELDPTATEQANAKNGVEFHLPGASENH